MGLFNLFKAFGGYALSDLIYAAIDENLDVSHKKMVIQELAKKKIVIHSWNYKRQCFI